MKYLIIDAYNVICSTYSLRQNMQDNLDIARDKLIEAVRSIHDLEEVHVVLVLDSRQNSLQVIHPLKIKTFELVYAPVDISADGVIERMVARVEKPHDTTVVTNDQMVRESVRTQGAIVMRPHDLLKWVDACQSRINYNLRGRVSNEKTFCNKINLEQFK